MPFDRARTSVLNNPRPRLHHNAYNLSVKTPGDSVKREEAFYVSNLVLRWAELDLVAFDEFANPFDFRLPAYLA